MTVRNPRSENESATSKAGVSISIIAAASGDAEARDLAVDLARLGFETTNLRPAPLPTEFERDARRRRGRPEPADPVVLQRQREAAANRRIYRHAIGTVINVL